MLRNTFAVLALVLTAASANAAVIGVATLVKNPPGNPFTAPDTLLPAPWVAYQLSLQSTAGELIQAIDVSFTGNKLHQRWQDGDFDGVSDPTPQGAPSNGRGDSHITAPAGAPFGLPASETNTKAGSPLAGAPPAQEYGLGNLLGAWAIPGQAATTANVAYIVFNSQDVSPLGVPNFQLTVKSANPSGGAFADLNVESFFPPIPEPATMSLVGLALAACLGFRRRNG